MNLNLTFFINSILLGVGLAMDAFSVSIANGLSEPCMKSKRVCFIAGVFSVFQFLMPMLGWVCVTTIAHIFKIPAILVGLTIVAFGTSLPELVTSVVAAKKGENDLALGNVVGSNIMNISLILGTVGLIGQAPISSVILTDMAILFVSTIIFVIACVQREKVSRAEGILFVSMYMAYLIFAIVRNYCF